MLKAGLRKGLAVLAACWLAMTLFVIPIRDYAPLLEDPTQVVATVAAVACQIVYGFQKVVGRRGGS